jgi:hypothetical protein
VVGAGPGVVEGGELGAVVAPELLGPELVPVVEVVVDELLLDDEPLVDCCSDVLLVPAVDEGLVVGEPVDVPDVVGEGLPVEVGAGVVVGGAVGDWNSFWDGGASTAVGSTAQVTGSSVVAVISWSIRDPVPRARSHAAARSSDSGPNSSGSAGRVSGTTQPISIGWWSEAGALSQGRKVRSLPTVAASAR